MLVNKILDDRYQIQQELSKKNGRKTLLAHDLHTSELVVIKLLSLSSDFEWDDLKLFEREAETLKKLSHPSIPRYLNYFDVNLQNLKGFALVQTYIPAKTLEQYLQAGRTFTEEEVKEIALSILEILIYLHEQNPPVIHRDIKPSNILLTDRSGNSVGNVYLVDFGSVQTISDSKGGTMTIVGTYGYMPPEQFGGRTVASSDLYGLGATLIYLVTGTHPADLPQKDFRIQFRQKANLTPSFTNWLQQMTEPRLEERLDSAKLALQSLNEPRLNLICKCVKKPFGSKIKLTKNIHSIEIFIPPSGFFDLIKAGASMFFLTPIIWGLTWFLTFQFFSLGLVTILFLLFFWLPLMFLSLWILIFWVCFPYSLIDSLLGKRRLRIESELIYFTHELLGFEFESFLAIKNITKLIYNPGEFINKDREQYPDTLEIWGENQKIKISSSIKSNVEKEWIAHELSEWLNVPITQN
ncbi:serine/threonine-protein kinase [Trichocoleus sp. DQ-U1]|uniref:serine/threonine protein kinase n=1 Tax=Trichocoleus sp. DQ-U1 TaxID=2933926 RepID=UPI0032992489